MPLNDHLDLDNCIKCSICVTNCPVARVTEKFAGPKQNGPDLERFRLDDPAAVHPSIGYCSNCKNCDVACPSGVNIATMNSKAKGEYVARNGAPLRDKLLARVGLMGRVCHLAPALANWGGQVKPFRWLGEKMFGVSKDMTLPHYAGKTFYQLARLIKPATGPRKVIYFPGCYVTYNTPEVGVAVLEVLAKQGVKVKVEKFNCCGLPLIANGLLADAKQAAQRNIEQLQKYIDEGYQIITSCPSCNLTLRREYQELFGFDTASLNDNILDVFEYLNELAEQGQLAEPINQVDMRVGYHQPCHLKAAGCGVPSKEIMNRIPGLKVQDLDAGCCGLSGSYGFKVEKYPVSMEIGNNVFRAVKQLGVKEVISECGMCNLQIQHGTGVAVAHPIQLLAQAYGISK